MRSIPLASGKSVVVDDEDFESISSFSWHSMKYGKTYYAVRIEKADGSKRRKVYMHRQIMGFPTGLEIDHDDGDGLNNRRSNLIPSTHARNLLNRVALAANNTSGVTGVSWSRHKKKWDARISVRGRQICLGTFLKKKEAEAAVKNIRDRELGR